MTIIFPLKVFQWMGLLPPIAPPSDALEGEIVNIVKPGQEWRIRFRATYWTARTPFPDDLQPGDRVRIVGHRTVAGRTSNTLLVERL